MIRNALKQATCAALFLLLILPVTAQNAEAGSRRLLLPVKQGRLWGYADTSSNMVIAPQFDAANPFEGKVAVIEKKQKAFAIDSTGKILTPGFDQLILVTDSIISFYLNEVSDSLGGWGLATLSGRLILPPASDEIYAINSDLYAFRKDSLWGVVSSGGTILTPPAYDTIVLFQNKFLLLTKGKKKGAMGTDGTRYLADEYSRIYFPNHWTIAAILDAPKNSPERGWGAVNLQPEIVVPFGFDSLFRITEFFVGLEEKDSLSCYFPLSNGLRTPARYKDLLPLDLYWIKLYDFSGHCGLADTLGNMLVPVAYSDITVGGNGNWFVADSAKKWGFYSSDGKLMLPPSFTYINPFAGKLAVVYDGKKQGLINDKGEILVPPDNQNIVIRGSTVKMIRSDNTATFLSIDGSGRIANRSNYDEFRVIRIGGREDPVTVTPDKNARKLLAGGGASYTPRIDSLDWFFDAKRQRWGMRNTFTGDTVLPAQFIYVTKAPAFCTLVAISDTVQCMNIDGMQTYATQLVGLVNDTTGKFVLHPRYTNIMIADLGPGGFSGYVRTMLPGGRMALVSTDGTERVAPYTWIEKPSNGYARVCMKGKWTIYERGEMVASLFNFSREQGLHNILSFGKAALSSDFMEKNLCIAGGKWGYIDTAGKLIIPMQYDGAHPSFGGTGIVKQEKKWGMIDMTGTIKIPFVYDALSYQHTDSSTIVIAQNNSMRYGYIDRNGNILIPADLKQSKQLGKGFIGFSRTGKWGVMKTNGETVCDERYHEILPFSEGVAAVRLGNRWGYIDTTGAEIIPPKYDKAGPFHEGMARVLVSHRWGFINRQGSLEIETSFLQARDFSGLSAPVKTREGWGLVDKKGAWLQKPDWSSIVALDSLLPGFFIVRRDYLQGICLSDGKLLVAPRFEGYKYLGEARIAYRSGSSWGLMDTLGKTITPSYFDLFKPFSEGLAPALRDGKWGYINSNGRFIIRPQFRIATGFIDHRAYVYSENNTPQMIDTTGKTVFIMPRQMILLGYSEGKYLVGSVNRKNEIDKKYFITRHGIRVNRFEYKEARLFQNGAARVCPGGVSWGLISFTGYYLVKPHFFMIGPFENGIACFQMRYVQGAFSLDGKPILPVEYDSVQYDEDLGMIRFERGNAMGYLFGDGRICWPEAE